MKVFQQESKDDPHQDPRNTFAIQIFWMHGIISKVQEKAETDFDKRSSDPPTDQASPPCFVSTSITACLDACLQVEQTEATFVRFLPRMFCLRTPGRMRVHRSIAFVSCSTWIFLVCTFALH
jgi:hypothetical protein